MAHIIEVKDLVKQYPATRAVDGVSFTVERGETFGILGPNGAGKTTTLEIIEGLKKPTSGTISVSGLDVHQDASKVKGMIGVQLQSSSFFEGLNLVELLDVFASMYGRTVKPMELLEEVQLTEKAKSQVKELSGGQKQRLSIAVALVNDPEVLFLDEPTTGLDPQARRNLWDLVNQIKAKGKTIVLTTHYMDEAEVLCDRIAIMDQGKIVALDTTANLLVGTGVAPTITFTTHAPVETQNLESLPGVTAVSQEGHAYHLTTMNPQGSLGALFDRSKELQFSMQELTLHRVTLEDVFLKLTGHALRD